ncbi:uncharacterized protein QC763_512034 [Podospora pseudopauciseta]|uniref:Uncharacterized protein n=1 Tax=Podospora pseudopauciseta TaxID=2093780 RepID=A0ABR0H970_9PEZI|nr:hypothetical protein QC763_512034 [Podospora pseudopauciseta]
MPPRKEIGVPSTAPRRRSSRVDSREATTTPEPAHPPGLKATKAPASATPKPPNSSTVRHRLRRRSPRTQATIEEELAGEVQDAAAGQDVSEERKASAVDSFDWSTLTRENQFCYGNEEEHISVGTGFHLLGTNKHITSQYPSPYNMRFEIQSGNSKINKSWGVRIIGGADGIKMIPFVNIERVIIILPEPKAKRQKNHRVLIVPTAATGSSPLNGTTADAKKDEQNSLMIGFDELPVELLDELKKWSEGNRIKTTRMNLGGLSTTMPETHQRQASRRRV